MTSIRYFNAFLLSALTFSLLYVGYLSLPKQKKILKPSSSKVIKIAIVTPPKKIVKPVVKQVAPAPIVAPIVSPLAAKKVVKKKIIKPKPKRVIKKRIIKKPKPKKIIKKKRVIKKKVTKRHKPKKVIKKKLVKKRRVIKKHKPKKVIKKKVIKKKIVEEYVETYVAPAPLYVEPKSKIAPVKRYVPAPKPIVQPTVQPTVIKPAPIAQKTPKNNHNRKAFLRNVRSKIIANKTYPRIAKRRHIEGSVKVRFDINKQGEVRNIRFINGKSVFHKSIREALARSFPMSIPPNVQGELPIFDISVVLHFNIR